jgi:hypothetical protein
MGADSSDSSSITDQRYLTKRLAVRQGYAWSAATPAMGLFDGSLIVGALAQQLIDVFLLVGGRE